LFLHCSSVFFYNSVLIFFLPYVNMKSFQDSPSLIAFYLLKCIYMTLSALQICYGYPQTTRNRFMTKKPSEVRDIAFTVYRAIPFVFELKTLLDFIVSDTTLVFPEFLKLEDLYAELFLVKCSILTNCLENNYLWCHLVLETFPEFLFL